MAKILIVEDDPMMSRMYEKAFLAEGFEVEMAHDGQEGVDKAKTVAPNLILLDVMMPRLNGMQALEYIKSDPNTKMIPVIMLTNLGGQKDAEEAVRMGALKYLLKSDMEPGPMVAEVRAALNIPASAQTPPAQPPPSQP
jgi:DNA-binding response OmpR family regulator